jgi:hypothetical protein
VNHLDLNTLREYHHFLEYRFGRLEKKQLNAYEQTREDQMQKYLEQSEAVLNLIDRIEAEAK